MNTGSLNWLWQSGASYYVAGCGVVLLDRSGYDYSRFVQASDLKPDMTAGPIGQVVEQAVAFTGMRQVPIEDCTKFFSERFGVPGARIRR